MPPWILMSVWAGRLIWLLFWVVKWDRPAHVAIVKTGAGRPMRPVYGEISLQAVEQFRGRTKAHGLPALGRGMRWGKGCQGAGVGLVQQDPGQFLPIALVGRRCRL